MLLHVAVIPCNGKRDTILISCVSHDFIRMALLLDSVDIHSTSCMCERRWQCIHRLSDVKLPVFFLYFPFMIYTKCPVLARKIEPFIFPLVLDLVVSKFVIDQNTQQTQNICVTFIQRRQHVFQCIDELPCGILYWKAHRSRPWSSTVSTITLVADASMSYVQKMVHWLCLQANSSDDKLHSNAFRALALSQLLDYWICPTAARKNGHLTPRLSCLSKGTAQQASGLRQKASVYPSLW